METVRDFFFLDSKITADADRSHKIKRHLLLGRKAMTNLESNKKKRHYFADKIPYNQSYGFFQKSYMDVRVGLQRKLNAKEFMLLNFSVGEDS